jgi:hypothetical protein
MRCNVVPGLLAAMLAGPATSLVGQSMEVRPEPARATLGQPVALHIRVRLPHGMQLIDASAHPLVPPPRGIRILRSDSLTPRGNGEFTSTATVAFYRIGPQPVPTLGLLYRTGPGAPPDTLVHLPVSVEIASMVPAGNPELKDIKPLRPVGGPIWGPAGVLLALTGAALGWLVKRSRVRITAAIPTVVGAIGPFEVALARLDQLAAAASASSNGIEPLYEGLAKVIRDCLTESGAIPHQGLTTAELGQALPDVYAAAGRRGRCEALLGAADLVKFARWRPPHADAQHSLAAARTLIQGWRTALAPIPEPERDHADR